MDRAGRIIGSDDYETVQGFWQIVRCVPDTATQDKFGIEGTIFHLSSSGDVRWKVPEGSVTIPLFKCQTFELAGRGPTCLIRFGSYKGHVIEFRMDGATFLNPHYYVPQTLVLVSDGWFNLQLHAECIERPQDWCSEADTPYSLLPALEDSYFSDMVIVASNNKQFRIHTCILKMSAPELDWHAKPPPLSKLPEDVLGTILHFLYAQCLPAGLEEAVANQVIAAVADLAGMQPLADMCQTYLKNLAFKNQIMRLMGEMHTCATQATGYFSGRHGGGDRHNSCLASDPAELCFAVKSSVREAAVAASKLLVLCHLYSQRKDELSRNERREIIRYAKSRVPMFMSQLERFLQAIKCTFTSLLPSQRQEVACYLVPEIETILDTLSSFLTKATLALEAIVGLSEAELDKEEHAGDMFKSLADTLNRSLKKKQLATTRSLLHRATITLIHLQQKKESFKVMTTANKMRSVCRNLEQIMSELPIFLFRLEEFTTELADQLEWNESQFCFNVATSKVDETAQHLVAHKECTKELMVELCDLVQRDSFTHSLVSLGLLDPSLVNMADEDTSDKWLQQDSLKLHGCKLNLMESLCVSPAARRNRLSKAAGLLLRSGVDSDMMLEVVPAEKERESGEGDGEGSEETQVLRIQGHRVIVAARCDWFRRALLSGMQEDIQRKIEVHNTNSQLFTLFLEYLYTGQVDCASLSVDQVAEMLLLSDRYELDSLKHVCESELKAHLDDDSVLYFLSIADQFNAKTLKTACTQFVMINPDVMDCELFDELPDTLQNEIYDLVIWRKPPTSSRLLTTSPNSSDKSVSPSTLEQMTASVHLSSSETLEGREEDSSRLEPVLAQLRDIVGHGAPRSQLIQVVLAADYDLNRALNFYYSTS